MMSSSNSKAKIPRKYNKLEKQEEKSNAVAIASTPTKNTRHLETDKAYSPVFLPCTQESTENVDVMWDWNSPQSKLNLHRKQKRLLQTASPKLPIKKQSSSTQLENFDNLKEQLKAFQEEINPENDSQLESHDSTDNNSESFDNLFDDSIEDQLILVSQQIEAKYEKDVQPAEEPENKLSENEGVAEASEPNKLQVPTHSNSPRKFLTKSLSSNTLDSAMAQSPVRKVTKKSQFNFISKMHELRNESCTNDSKEVHFELPKNPVTPNNSPLKFKARSLSFGDHCTNNKKKDIIIDDKLKEEIERKRLQAKAKLKSKQMQETSDSDTSPIKCSPEEIEVKRKMALARLESKRQQELIERKRQEALKKREQKNKQIPESVIFDD
ncbi:PREDICTED: uncharacterized protein LOC108559013 [Nicrophorus vespilloides]|uniref:Uncharacterized protein LOC108559013 n=1 Tax=Nicrophorus vespilloides TaxID=110193 RepID=A0ABM1MAL8_NICVS|nr:PREDICTED: uncharacterized protein LOC108559013 [Nicrophorus vespilloides]